MFTAIARLATVLALAATVGGCAGNLRLLEDGKVHVGRYDQLSRTLEINIDGVIYSGTFVQGVTSAVGVSMVGARTVPTIGVGTDGGGQALLTSPQGKILRCQFGPVVGWRGQGQCQSNDGKVYDLLIG